jgi:hypothetical protein
MGDLIADFKAATRGIYVADIVEKLIRAITETEKDRIINLLSVELTCDECELNGFENDIATKAIALIKGEN